MVYPATMAETVSFLLRLPPKMLARLRAIAAREHRSVSGQIAHILGQWLTEHDPEWSGD